MRFEKVGKACIIVATGETSNEVQGSVEKTPNVRRFPADWLHLMVSGTLSNYCIMIMCTVLYVS